MATAIPRDIRDRIVELFHRSTAPYNRRGAEIGRLLNMDRAKINYVLRQELRENRKPPPYTRDRTCARCGVVETVVRDNKAEFCSPCARVNGAISKRHGKERWTRIPCAHCQEEFEILYTDITRKRTSPRTGVVDDSKPLYCSGDCYHKAVRARERPRRSLLATLR